MDKLILDSGIASTYNTPYIDIPFIDQIKIITLPHSTYAILHLITIISLITLLTDDNILSSIV